MPSGLKFQVPVQGAGIGGGVGQESGVEWHHVYALAGDANGYEKWSRQKNYTGFTHDSEFLMRLRNRGSGGRHLIALKSTDASTILQITDAGLSLTALTATSIATGTLTASGQITSTVATGTAPLVIASTTLIANLNADLFDNQSSAFYQARANHTGTQTPSTISPQGPGSGLNADLFDDLDSTAFATSGHNHDATYVNATGDTMTGVLTIELSSGNDQALKLKHNAGAGGVWLGGENAADPDFIIKNNASTQIGRFTNEGLFIAGSATAAVSTAGAADVQCQDLWLVDGANYRRLLANGSTFFLSRNGDGANSDVTVDSSGTLAAVRLVANAAGLDGSEELLVNGQSRLKGQVVVTTGGLQIQGGGIQVDSGSSTFSAATAFSAATTFTATVQMVGIDLDLSTAFIDFDAGSTAGFTEDTWSGYIQAKHDGATIYIPYLSSPP